MHSTRRRTAVRPGASDVWGFVLANVTPGKEPEFFSNLGAIHQVHNVFYLFEDYEYLLEIEAESEQELAKIMTNHIRHIPGVERTASFMERNLATFNPIEREDTLREPAKTIY